jgi:hypothetical protein
MAIKMGCVHCGQEYELDDSMGGRQLACQCGKNLKVPSNKGGSGSTATPKTKHGGQPVFMSSLPTTEMPQIPVVPPYDASKIGTQEQKLAMSAAEPAPPEESNSDESDMSDESEESVESALVRFLPLIKLAVLLVIAAIVGVGGYSLFFAKKYGISSSYPLGIYKKLDAHLVKIHLERDATAKPAGEAFGKKARFVFYRDTVLAGKTKGLIQESAYLATDDAGIILGVGGTFYTSDVALPGAGGNSKIGRCLAHYWKEVGGPPLEFEEIMHGKPPFRWTEFRCIAETEGKKMQWSRRANEGVPLFEFHNTVDIVEKSCNSAGIPGRESEFGEFESGDESGTTDAKDAAEAIKKALFSNE